MSYNNKYYFIEKENTVLSKKIKPLEIQVALFYSNMK